MKLAEWIEKEGLGAQVKLANLLKVTPGLVWQWLDGRTRVTAERAKEIYTATNGEVALHELRPDVFDPPPPPRTEPVEAAA